MGQKSRPAYENIYAWAAILFLTFLLYALIFSVIVLGLIYPLFALFPQYVGFIQTQINQYPQWEGVLVWVPVSTFLSIIALAIRLIWIAIKPLVAFDDRIADKIITIKNAWGDLREPVDGVGKTDDSQDNSIKHPEENKTIQQSDNCICGECKNYKKGRNPPKHFFLRIHPRFTPFFPAHKNNLSGTKRG